ncbi:hypothetical protein [Halorussus lipolyticus]|uniref:DUF7856 family protein n=1 Tax=Halorussus lipolyticus TaxID=3034024 RepID=UPI0023E7F04F|nr:hypothetical protein [Halorussus sp. DT80]
MRVELAGEVRTGRVVDLRDTSVDFDASAVVGAIRGDGPRAGDGPARPLAIDCPVPGPAHEHVGAIRTGMGLSLRPALADAARTRGHTPTQADELAAVRDRLSALDPPEIDLRSARRRVAETSDDAEELRERVAALRGRVQALRDAGDESGPAEAELASATRELSEVETERIAAEQALSRARNRAAENRERRRERLRLADRADNLCRDAREELARAVRPTFEDARQAVPTDSESPVSTALAVAHVADLDAPVVVGSGVDAFADGERLSEWFDAPVVRL